MGCGVRLGSAARGCKVVEGVWEEGKRCVCGIIGYGCACEMAICVGFREETIDVCGGSTLRFYVLYVCCSVVKVY